MKKNLSDQIAEGIWMGFWEPIAKIILYVSIFVLVILFGTYIHGHIQESKICGSWNCFDNLPDASAERFACSYPYVRCFLVVGNQTEETLILDKQFCGYSEAGAYYDLNIGYNQRLLNDFNKRNNLSFTIKRWQCE
ncbi:MAG: hypothetical protein AABY22_24575 [Nanoarchaeota archaeon]